MTSIEPKRTALLLLEKKQRRSTRDAGEEEEKGKQANWELNSPLLWLYETYFSLVKSVDKWSMLYAVNFESMSSTND